MHDPSYGRVFVADGVHAGCQRAEPVGGVNDVWACNPGEQILGAAGEADHLVRKDRTADDQVIVVQNQPVQRDGDRLC